MNKHGNNLIFNKVNIPEVLSKEEEKELGKKLKSTDEKIVKEAKDKFVLCNIRLVMLVAGGFRENKSLGFEDMVSEGIIGLTKAVERFDPDKGIKFSTYAVFWVRQHIFRVIANQSRTVRLPVGFQAMMTKAQFYVQEYLFKNKEYPTESNLKEKFGVSSENARKILEYNYAESSLDADVDADVGCGKDDSGYSGDNSFASYIDFIEAKETDNPSTQCEKKSERKLIDKCLDKLNKNEKAIIVSRFGLNNEKPMTLEGVGRQLNLSRERIRQIESVALEKLKKLTMKEDKVNV